MAIQELDYTLEFTKGTKNLIADGFSRLCPNRMVEFPKEYSMEIRTLQIERIGTEKKIFDVES